MAHLFKECGKIASLKTEPNFLPGFGGSLLFCSVWVEVIAVTCSFWRPLLRLCYELLSSVCQVQFWRFVIRCFKFSGTSSWRGLSKLISTRLSWVLEPKSLLKLASFSLSSIERMLSFDFCPSFASLRCLLDFSGSSSHSILLFSSTTGLVPSNLTWYFFSTSTTLLSRSF